jgi:ABC-2 type transport system permease protein
MSLLRQRLRRDWLQLLLWVLGTVLLTYSGVAGVSQSYGTHTDRVTVLAAVMANPVIMLFRGLPSGASEGQFMSFEILPWLTMLAALMSTFLAVRHSRGDEEAGRAEVVASTPAARSLPTIATLIHGVGANVVLGLLVALALIGAKQEASGSWLTGAVTATTGIAFLGIGLMAAQLMRTSRGANSLTIWILVGTFILNGIGNAAGTPSNDLTRITSSWIVWLSPFGWAEQARPYDTNLWGPALLGLVFGIALGILATALQSVRDLGEGFIPARLGREHARPGLASSQALVWRLSYGSIIGWAIGGALTGLLATTLSSVLNQVSAGNSAVTDILQKLGGGSTLDNVVITVFFTMLGILGACAAVQTISRARQEEAHGTAELILSTTVGRVKWLSGYLIVAVSSIVIVAATAMVTGYLGAASNNATSEMYRNITVTGLSEMVAAAVFAVVTALIFVVIPRGTIALGWSLLLLATLFGMFGPLFGLPEWTTHVSPFGVTPVLKGDTIDVRGLWWLVGIVAVGWVGSLGLMRRRELAPAG